ncbi:hypothetical protein EsDP_00001848 [Epichloe bromicola]
MHPYGQRTVRAWQCRFSKLGWTVRVVDGDPGSPSNISNLIDINDPDNFPRSFTEGTLGGRLETWKRMWKATVGNPNSPYEVLTYNAGSAEDRNITNNSIAANANNPLILRSHKLLLALWAEDGGKTCADGMHTSVLLKELPLTPFHLSFAEDGKVYSAEDVTKMLADYYIIQGQAIRMVMSTENPSLRIWQLPLPKPRSRPVQRTSVVFPEDGWNRPKYSAEHVFAIDYMIGSQLINKMTAWNSPRQFELMSLPLPKAGEAGSKDQKLARGIVEACLGKSFGPRARDNLYREHGLVLYKVDTLINVDLL